MSKERPILFSGPMVRAILEGRKTQTRRVIKLKDGRTRKSNEFACPFRTKSGEWSFSAGFGAGFQYQTVKCPYGEPGDRLWVRETFGFTKGNGIRTVYRADGEEPKELLTDRTVKGMKWKPSIHMPRWASRITLEITNVRVERLQQISNSDALAEGVADGKTEHSLREQRLTLAQHAFANLWESINGKDSWDQNPWVWVIEFKKI